MENNTKDSKDIEKIVPFGTDITAQEPIVETSISEPKPSHMRRMIMALDRFLDRRIAGIGILYFVMIMAGGILLFTDGVVANASAGNAEGLGMSFSWLYALLGVMTFVFVVVVARVLFLRLHRKSVDGTSK